MTAQTLPRFAEIQMTTVFLPNPRLGDDPQLLRVPDWSRLETRYRLRGQFIGERMPDGLEAMAERLLPEGV